MCKDNQRKPHVHADVIKAWADGAVVEHFSDGKWFTLTYPKWLETTQYRVKPEPTDLEKYGVEVGDVWHNDLGFPFFVATVVSPESFRCLDKHKYRKGVLITLVFRRGVVNKL